MQILQRLCAAALPSRRCYPTSVKQPSTGKGVDVEVTAGTSQRNALVAFGHGHDTSQAIPCVHLTAQWYAIPSSFPPHHDSPVFPQPLFAPLPPPHPSAFVCTSIFCRLSALSCVPQRGPIRPGPSGWRACQTPGPLPRPGLGCGQSQAACSADGPQSVPAAGASMARGHGARARVSKMVQRHVRGAWRMILCTGETGKGEGRAWSTAVTCGQQAAATTHKMGLDSLRRGKDNPSPE